MLMILLGCLIAAIVILLAIALTLCSKDVVDYRVYAVRASAAKTKTVVSRDRGSNRAEFEGPNRSGSTAVAKVVPAPAPAPEVVPVEAAESAPEVVPVEAAESAPEVQHINDVTAPKFAEFGDNETVGKGAA
jgi:hypothetical protein